MEKIVLMIMIAMISAASVRAQSAEGPNTAETRAAALTEKMKTELSLTDDQYPQVQALNLKYAQKNAEIFKGSDGKFAKFRALKSSQKAKNKEMKVILNKDQYKRYEKMVEEMKNNAMEQYKERK